MAIAAARWPTARHGDEQPRRAADGQQPLSMTIGEPARKPWRIMTADSAVDGR
jgi:hypothetical protein